MTKDDIKKALESCVTYKNVDCNNCPCCPYDGQILCQDVLCKDALNLISEQEKEIDGLKAENARLTEKLKQVLLAVDTVKEMNTMCSIDEQRKRAVQDFAEKLKEKALLHCRTINCYECKFIETTIDELLEEYNND